MAPDVVYVVRAGDRNEELRYSLRSLANVPHGRVWIAGYRPSWVSDEVGLITAARVPGAHAMVKAQLRAACEHPEVAESFYYFNDDFFVMDRMDRIPAMHRGPIRSALKQGMARAYTRAMRATLESLEAMGHDEPLCFEVHGPMPVTKAGMLRALDRCNYPMMQERSLFANVENVDVEKGRNYKVYHGDRGWQGWPFLSTNDASFARYEVGEVVRASFPRRSPYELTAEEYMATRYRVGSKKDPRPPRKTVRYHAVSTIRRIGAERNQAGTRTEPHVSSGGQGAPLKGAPPNGTRNHGQLRTEPEPMLGGTG